MSGSPPRTPAAAPAGPVDAADAAAGGGTWSARERHDGTAGNAAGTAAAMVAHQPPSSVAA